MRQNGNATNQRTKSHCRPNHNRHREERQVWRLFSEQKINQWVSKKMSKNSKISLLFSTSLRALWSIANKIGVARKLRRRQLPTN